jgi:hypothetical protein
MQQPTIGAGVTATNRALPPLGEPVHIHIMIGHVHRKARDLPTRAAEASAQFRLLTRDQIFPKTAERRDGRQSHERDATAGFCVACRHVPLQVGEPVEAAHLGKALPQPSADDREVGPSVELGRCDIDPRIK